MITRLITTTFVLTYLACTAVRAQEPEDLRPGVVRIYNAAREEQGTGFIIRIRAGKAYVISAAHVVEGGQNHEIYLFNQPNEPLRGRVIDMEAGEPFGLALLEINVDEGLIPGLKELELGSASGLRGGEGVQVIGFPARTRQWTILPAAVARIEGRKIVFAGSIQGGNSGGPVLLGGKVVGVVVERNESESLSYAAQADSVVQYVKGIEERLFPAVKSATREADRGSIYITKIIDPPRGGSPRKSTVWLAASGRQTYIVDSITIESSSDACKWMTNGAREPDANYAFSFPLNSRKTHALNPALSLDPKDPREVSFTLILKPGGRFSSFCGSLSAQIHYHTADGPGGTLRLEKPPLEGRLLAKLLGADVKVGTLIITPQGFQRGRDEWSDEPSIVYEALRPPKGFYVPDDKLPQPLPRIELTPERLALNAALVRKGSLPEVLKLLMSGDGLAFDLCAGLQNPQCLEALMKAGKYEKLRDNALKALTISHLIKPAGDLAAYILSSDISKAERFTSKWFTYSDAITALTLYPRGEWVRALFALASDDPRLIFLWLYLRRNELSEPERKLVEDICWNQFYVALPDKTAMKYLLWRGHLRGLIEERLTILPPSLLKDSKASNYKLYRERLREDLFGTNAEKPKGP